MIIHLEMAKNYIVQIIHQKYWWEPACEQFSTSSLFLSKSIIILGGKRERHSFFTSYCTDWPSKFPKGLICQTHAQRTRVHSLTQWFIFFYEKSKLKLIYQVLQLGGLWPASWYASSPRGTFTVLFYVCTQIWHPIFNSNMATGIHGYFFGFKWWWWQTQIISQPVKV